MWAMDRTRRMFVVLTVLVLTCTVRSSMAQQVGAGTGTEKKADPIGGGAPVQVSAGPQGGAPDATESVPQSNHPNDETNVSAGVRVLKPGEKIPERKDASYEDWNKPELTPGMHMNAVPMGTVNRDGFTRQLLAMQWREMDPIDLWIIKPAGVKNPPVILYLYSYNGTNARYKDDDFCKFLTKDGYAAVGFVSAVTEQRFHDRAMRETFVSELQEGLGSTAHDVQMILNYLEQRGDFDMQRVGMWGDGSGASIAILAASVDSRIKALDLLDPWGDWPDWLANSSLVPEDRRPEFTSARSLGTVENLEPLKALPKLNKQKVRLQYIKDGIKVTPAIAREKMEAAAPANVEITHYSDMKQFVSEVGSKGTGFDWIKQKLAAPSRAENEAPSRKGSLTPNSTSQ